MRFRLITLLTLTVVVPPLLAGLWRVVDAPAEADGWFFSLVMWGLILLAIHGMFIEEQARRDQLSELRKKPD